MSSLFPVLAPKLTYELLFEEIEPGTAASDWRLRPCRQWRLSIRSGTSACCWMTGTKNSITAVTGDPREGVAEFIEQCDIAVHEAFMLQDEFPYHGSDDRLPGTGQVSAVPASWPWSIWNESSGRSRPRSSTESCRPIPISSCRSRAPCSPSEAGTGGPERKRPPPGYLLSARQTAGLQPFAHQSPWTSQPGNVDLIGSLQA